MGDVLADYQDSGRRGSSFPLAFGFYDAGGFYPGRRWLQPRTTAPLPTRASLWFQDRTLGTYDAGHPLMQGVTALATNFGQSRSGSRRERHRSRRGTPALR